MLWLLFMLLPIAAFSGWYWGKKTEPPLHTFPLDLKLRRDYFKGLTHLINEQPDKALDVFIKLFEVDSDTVETHLALGNLFRRRGEVDRAIRIHQNLIARPQLEKEYHLQALSELGQDYLSAGVLDRAERLFLELVDLEKKPVSSLKHLLDIYQQEKDWEKAITTAYTLASVSHESMNTVIAQYYCELALKSHAQGKCSLSDQQLKKAQAIDASCVRASIIKAQLAMACGEYRQAIRYYQMVAHQDSDFLSEIIQPICYCYRQIYDEKNMSRYLYQCLAEDPRISIVIELSDYLHNRYDEKAAIEFIAEHIRKNPSLQGLAHLIKLYRFNEPPEARQLFAILDSLLEKLLIEKSKYQCCHCGFSSQTLYWLCPSCHHWSTNKPIQGG